MPSRPMGLEAVQFLKGYAREHYVPCFEVDNVDQSTFWDIVPGANYTKAVVDWFVCCSWPPDVSSDYSRTDDSGISWLKLMFSFILHSRRYPPVKASGHAKNAVFWGYNSVEALHLPASTRAAPGCITLFNRPFWP